MTQEGNQVITILPIKSKMAAAMKQCFMRFLCLTESLPSSFKLRGLQMTINLALGSSHANSPNGRRGNPSDLLTNSQLDRCN